MNRGGKKLRENVRKGRERLNNGNGRKGEGRDLTRGKNKGKRRKERGKTKGKWKI